MRYRSIAYLRGIAAFFVAYGHLTYAFVSRDFLNHDVGAHAAAVLGNSVNNIPPGWLIIPSSGTWVNVFFLISGFVIEMSIRRVRSTGFVIQRALRIYPVFLVGWVLEILASRFVLHKPFPPGWLNNLLLVDGSSFVDVSWSLIIEMHFYIFIAVICLVFASVRMRLVLVHVVLLCLLLLDSSAHAGAMNWYLRAFLIINGFYISFMGIGTMLFYVLKESPDPASKARHIRFFLVHTALAFLELTLVINSPTGGQFIQPSFANWFASGAVIFFVAIWAEQWLWKSRVLEFLGDISYPLYCVHFPLGWALHYAFVAGLGWSPLASLCATMPLVILFSYLVHRVVENPTNALGKAITVRYHRTGRIIAHAQPEPVNHAAGAGRA